MTTKHTCKLLTTVLISLFSIYRGAEYVKEINVGYDTIFIYQPHPTTSPTNVPTLNPTKYPTDIPTQCTSTNTPTNTPTAAPTPPTNTPTSAPTKQPTPPPIVWDNIHQHKVSSARSNKKNANSTKQSDDQLLKIANKNNLNKTISTHFIKLFDYDVPNRHLLNTQTIMLKHRKK
eukprot:516400_1